MNAQPQMQPSITPQHGQISLADLPFPAWMLSARGESEYFNPAWLQFTGLSPGQGSTHSWLEYVHPDHRSEVGRKIAETLRTQDSSTCTYRLKHSSGSYRWVRQISVPKSKEQHQFNGLINYCIDIEDQQQAEATRKEMAERLVTAQESERTRIARELHDDISHSLVILGIQMLRSGQPVSGEPGKTHPGPAELYQKLKQLADRVSSISHELHSSSLEYLGLKKAIEGHCREFSYQHRIAMDCRCSDAATKLNGVASLCLLRIVQEALHNIAKHSHASNATVQLAQVSDAQLLLSITDDGVGFKVEEAFLSGGIGLLSMRERMKLLGGTCIIESSPGKGTAITCSLSLDEAPR